ncbi:unnamed protein product [Pylaiella littoralis]
MQRLPFQDNPGTAAARSVLHARGQVHFAEVAPPALR